MNCETCTHRPDPVPFAVHESAMARMERTIRRLWILLIVLVVLLVGSNALWIWYEAQFETVEQTEVEMENESGYASYVGRDGSIYNGADQGQMTKDDYSNTDVMLLILDRIHNVRDRQIMVDRFVHGLTFEKIAELHDMSVRQIKNIVYRGQDKIFK